MREPFEPCLGTPVQYVLWESLAVLFIRCGDHLIRLPTANKSEAVSYEEALAWVVLNS